MTDIHLQIMPKIKILVACHKADSAIRQDDIYMPIHVGKALHPELDLGFQCDNTGDNISEKNGSYCELTALYWAWKNLKDVDYVGLCHYRRYLGISTSKLTKSLSSRKIIIAQVKKLSTTLLEDLSIWTSLEDVYLLIDTVIALYPDYEQSIIDCYLMGNRFSVCNMFVMPKKEFDDYCQFLFTILFEVDKRLFKYPHSRQNRVVGYLSESLLLLWLTHNGLSYKMVPVFNLSSNRTLFRERLDNLRKDLSFLIGGPKHRENKIKIIEPVASSFRIDKIELRALGK